MTKTECGVPTKNGPCTEAALHVFEEIEVSTPCLEHFTDPIKQWIEPLMRGVADWSYQRGLEHGYTLAERVAALPV